MSTTRNIKKLQKESRAAWRKGELLRVDNEIAELEKALEEKRRERREIFFHF